MDEYGCIGFPLTTETSFPIVIIAKNSSGVPVSIASGTPGLTVYAPDGTAVKTASFSGSDLDSKTGTRRLALDVSSITGVAAGVTYHWVADYIISGPTTKYAHGTFQTR